MTYFGPIVNLLTFMLLVYGGIINLRQSRQNTEIAKALRDTATAVANTGVQLQKALTSVTRPHAMHMPANAPLASIKDDVLQERYRDLHRELDAIEADRDFEHGFGGSEISVAIQGDIAAVAEELTRRGLPLCRPVGHTFEGP